MTSQDNRPHLKISHESISKRPTEFEGGGATYQRSDFRSHGKLLQSEARSVLSRTQSTRDMVKDRAFIEVKVAPEEKLKDRYQNLLNNARINILDVINDTTGYGVIKTDDIPLLINRLNDYAETDSHTGKSYFSFIEELQLLNPIERISPELRELIKDRPKQITHITIESFSSLPRNIQEQGMVQQISQYLGSFNNDNSTYNKIIGSYIHSNGSVVIQADIEAIQVQSLTEAFDSIRLVEISPDIIFPDVMTHEENLSKINIQPLNGNATVCIFDTGVTETNSNVGPFILDNISLINAHTYNTSHGTFVASRVIFRDDLEDQIALGNLTPHAKILDVRVFGIDDLGNKLSLNETELIDAIRGTVERFHADIKVYNLSLGFMIPGTDKTKLSDTYMSRLAAELDFISKKRDVLFIISAGNIFTLNERLRSGTQYPNHFSDDTLRILPPAESFLSLTIGSVATKHFTGALAQVGHPSPFSRRGPGFYGSRKPDLSADGGNSTVSGITDRRINAVALGQNTGDIVYSNGTSYAAPVISSYAAELFDRLPDASVNLVKALLLHFSDLPQGANTFPRPNLYEHLGFGVPNLNLCLDSLASKASYIYEGSIPQQTYIRIPFWIPDQLITDTTRSHRKKLKLRITLVWNPLTDRRKQEQYSLVHLYPNLLKINSNGEEDQVALSTGLEESSYREKFFPTMRIEKQFERNISGGLWHLQLRMSSRWEVPEGYEQDFAVIITVEDPANQIDVYGEIQNQVGLRFQKQLRVR